MHRRAGRERTHLPPTGSSRIDMALTLSSIAHAAQVVILAVKLIAYHGG